MLIDKYIIYMRSTVLKSVLFIFSLSILIACLLLPVQLYGSAILCDPSLNLTNCDERSSSSSTSETIDNSRSDNIETPLIIPDISPTSKDLDDAMTDGDLGTTDTDVINDNDNDDSENSIDENSDTDRDDDKDSSNSEGGSSDNEPSLIPFP